MAEPFALRAVEPGDRSQRRRQALGAEAEACVRAMLAASERAGLGVLRKRTSTVVVRDGRRSCTGTKGCDFTGHLAGGRAVYLEVKHLEAPRLPLDALRGSQREELTRAERDGAAAVVVVLVGRPAAPRVYAVPWGYVAASLVAGAASLRGPALEAWRVANLARLLEAQAFRAPAEGSP